MKQTLRISEPHFHRLMRHLFPGDRDEHGAVITAGIVETPQGIRFLARDVILAKDGVDYVPGTRGYRALTTDFVVRVSDQCAREKLCYFAVHCHSGRDSVSFSSDDLASHRRGYPALLDITNGGPVGALVFAENAVAGEIWRPEGTSDLDKLTVVGSNIRHLFPSPPKSQYDRPAAYHRQSMLFGDRGQEALSKATVGIIGLGGVGALVNEWIARLGVGHIIAVDYDRVETTNLPRVVGATRFDAGEPFVSSRFGFVQSFGRWLSKHKVHIAARVARQANPHVRFDAIIGDIMDSSIANKLRTVDYLFLCADGMRPRLVFNALVHQYLIPGVQIGSKVPVDKKSGAVGDVFAVARRVLPFAGGGCLSCNKLIPADKLHDESLTPDERRRQQYVAEETITAPSVITLNAVAASHAVNDFLFGFQGLFRVDALPGYGMHYLRERRCDSIDVSAANDCLHCGLSNRSAFGRGDRWVLPCKTA